MSMNQDKSSLQALSDDFLLLCRELTDKAAEDRFQGQYYKDEGYEINRNMIVGVLEQHNCDCTSTEYLDSLFKP